MQNKRSVDIAVLSDLHFGTVGCHAVELAQYLNSVEPRILVLNRDIFDIWNFKKYYWPESYMRVLKCFLSMMANGTDIYYLTGNHDEVIRKISSLQLGPLFVKDKLILDLDGEKCWVFHGDIFDITMKQTKWVAKIGGKGYDHFTETKLADVPVVGLSHQSAFLSDKTPRPPKMSLVAEALLHHFAPVDHPLGFHFERYDHFIEPPIIRSDIRSLDTNSHNHITVYLPAYHHEVLQQIFAPFSHVDWHIFSPSCDEEIYDGNMWIHPVSNGPFLQSFANCKGVICNAGFETCAEAMYLGKKLLAIPIRNQYEQACNAAALERLGAKTLLSLDKKPEEIWHWLEERQLANITDIAEPKEIVQKIIAISLTEPQPSAARSFFGAV